MTTSNKWAFLVYLTHTHTRSQMFLFINVYFLILVMITLEEDPSSVPEVLVYTITDPHSGADKSNGVRQTRAL